MRTARFVRTLGLLLALVLPFLGGGCQSQSPAEKAKSDKLIQESHKKAHAELRDDLKKKAMRRGPS
jgi:hypothetical protein